MAVANAKVDRFVYFNERIAFAVVPVEVRYPDRIVGIALLLGSMQ
jgi:hypothetical protein